jgi:hypothetical protein
LPTRPARVVLGHQVHIDIRPQLPGHEPEDGLGLGQQAGHHQVTQQQPPPRQPVGVDHQRADLPVHLLDGLSGYLRIVWAAQVAAAAGWLHTLKSGIQISTIPAMSCRLSRLS